MCSVHLARTSWHQVFCSQEVRPAARRRPVDFTRRPPGEAAKEPLPVESVPGFRSEGYGILLAAELSAPSTRYSAPVPQGTSAPRKRMRGWVKAAIVVGSTIAGVAIFRAVIGPDEDLAPLPGQ